MSIKFERTYFAVTVRVWRRKSGFTLQDVSKSTDIPVSTLSMIERDEQIPKILELERLCEIMGENPSTFFRSAQKG